MKTHVPFITTMMVISDLIAVSVGICATGRAFACSLDGLVSCMLLSTVLGCTVLFVVIV